MSLIFQVPFHRHRRAQSGPSVAQLQLLKSWEVGIFTCLFDKILQEPVANNITYEIHYSTSRTIQEVEKDNDYTAEIMPRT